MCLCGQDCVHMECGSIIKPQGNSTSTLVKHPCLRKRCKHSFARNINSVISLRNRNPTAQWGCPVWARAVPDLSRQKQNVSPLVLHRMSLPEPSVDISYVQSLTKSSENISFSFCFSPCLHWRGNWRVNRSKQEMSARPPSFTKKKSNSGKIPDC